jgi:hypothetical protein
MRKLMVVFIVFPLVLASIVGLVSLLLFTTKLNSDTNAELAYSSQMGITAIVGEYTAFLTYAAELEPVKTAAVKTDSGDLSFISEYATNTFGVYDILITNSKGFVFASCSDNYSNSEMFRDVPELVELAVSPTPVSGFYEGGRFYCAKPVRDNEEIIGYIILESDISLISGYLSDVSEAAFNNKSIFAVFDENSNIISSDGEIGGILKDSAAAYSDRNNPVRYEQFERGIYSGAVGNVGGTKWRWIFIEPTATATAQAFSVFATAFAIAAGISVINIIAAIMVTKTKQVKQLK